MSNQGVELFNDTLARARRLSDDPLQQFLILIGLYEELFEGLTEPYPGCLLGTGGVPGGDPITVSEPSTLTLLAVGLTIGVVGYAIKRRRKK